MRCILALTVAFSFACKEQPKAVPANEAPGTGTQRAPEPAGKTAAEERPREDIIKEVHPPAGFLYFATEGGNHPAIFLDRGKKRLVVVGRQRALGGGTQQVDSFAPETMDDALAAYHGLLVKVGYQPAGAPAKEAPDPNTMVAVPISDLLGSGGPSQAFPVEQGKALYKTRPTKGWAILSGFEHPGNDAPAMAAHGGGLSVYAPGVHKDFTWQESAAAFELFKQVASKEP